MPDKGFVHLHLHSQYSLLDGAITFERLFKRCKDLGMESVALTDVGAIFLVGWAFARFDVSRSVPE